MFERVTHLTAPALLLVVLALFTAAPAMASPDDVVNDCADDGFVETKRHSRKHLRQGRDRIPADLDAYSDCTSQINAFLDKPRAGSAVNRDGFSGGDGAGGGGSGSASGGSGSAGSDGPLTGEEQRESAAVERKRRVARADTESLVGDRDVDPGTAGALEQADSANGISLPQLLVIIALALGLAAGAAAALRRRNPDLFAGALSRVPLPRRLGTLSPPRRRR